MPEEQGIFTTKSSVERLVKGLPPYTPVRASSLLRLVYWAENSDRP